MGVEDTTSTETSAGTESPTSTGTVTPPAVATPPTPPAATPTTRNEYIEVPEDHPLKTSLKAVKAELKTFKDKATQAEQEELARQKRYEDLLPLKIDEATTPLKSQVDKLQKDLEKKAKAYDELQAAYTGLETSVRSAKVQNEVKSAYLAAGALKEGADEAFNVIFSTHKDKFTLDGDTVKAGDQDLATFFGELKKAPVFSAMFATDPKPSGTGTPPTKAAAGVGSSGVKTISKEALMNRGWGKGDESLQAIIDGTLVIE